MMRCGHGPGENLRARTVEGGFSLMEALVGAVIAVIAVIGLAYSFGISRGSIDRFSVMRAAEAVGRGRMEYLTTLPPGDPGFVMVTPDSFYFRGVALGTVNWFLSSVPLGTPGENAIEQLDVVVRWRSVGIPDSLRYVRYVPR